MPAQSHATTTLFGFVSRKADPHSILLHANSRMHTIESSMMQSEGCLKVNYCLLASSVWDVSHTLHRLGAGGSSCSSRSGVFTQRSCQSVGAQVVLCCKERHKPVPTNNEGAGCCEPGRQCMWLCVWGSSCLAALRAPMYLY